MMQLEVTCCLLGKTIEVTLSCQTEVSKHQHNIRLNNEIKENVVVALGPVSPNLQRSVCDTCIGDQETCICNLSATEFCKT